MDCDLQDPPEEIPRPVREGAGGLRHRARAASGAPAFVRAQVRRSHLREAPDGARRRGDLERLRGVQHRLAQAPSTSFLEIKDSDRHYVPILHWLGFERAEIEVRHAERFAGTSAYSLRELVGHAMQGIFFQTTTLLRWIVYAGFLLALTGALLAVGFVVTYLVFSTGAPPGWTSLAVLLLFIGGFIIICTGVTGLYIGKIFSQVKERPLFIVEQEIGGAGADEGTIAAALESRSRSN